MRFRIAGVALVALAMAAPAGAVGTWYDHYLDVHAPLGMRVTRAMRGYTVNLVETEGGPDAYHNRVCEEAALPPPQPLSAATPSAPASVRKLRRFSASDTRTILTLVKTIVNSARI